MKQQKNMVTPALHPLSILSRLIPVCIEPADKKIFTSFQRIEESDDEDRMNIWWCVGMLSAEGWKVANATAFDQRRFYRNELLRTEGA